MTQPTDDAGTPDVSADTTPTESLQLADQQPLPTDAPAPAPVAGSGASHTRTILEVVGGVVAAGLIVVAGAVGFAVGHMAGSDDDRVAFSQAGDRGAFGQGEQGEQGQRGQGDGGQGLPGQGEQDEQDEQDEQGEWGQDMHGDGDRGGRHGDRQQPALPGQPLQPGQPLEPGAPVQPLQPQQG